MSPQMPSLVDDAEHTLGRAILLVAQARGRIAIRGQTNTTPLTIALGEVGRVLTEAAVEDAPHVLWRVKSLTEALAYLVAELSAERSGTALAAKLPSLQAFA